MCGIVSLRGHEEASVIVTVISSTRETSTRKERFILRGECGLWCHGIKMF